MRVKKVNRYYCDHCKKAGCQKAAMVRHEESCTRNPNRECRFCALHETWVGEYQHQRTLPELIAILQAGGLDKLRDASGQCPGCTFAAIIQSRDEQQKKYTGPEYAFEPAEGWISEEEFSLNVAMVAFFSVINESREEQRVRQQWGESCQ